MEYGYDQHGYVTLSLFSVLTMMSLALAVYTRSPASYEALKSFEILQLPCQSTLLSYTGAFLYESGVSNQCIADQVAQYVTFKADCEKQDNSGSFGTKNY